METIEWMGIYKGLRMPILALLLIAITIWVYRPSRRKKLEQPALDMLDDELDEGLSQKFKSTGEKL